MADMILITGGAGFIGSNVVAELCGQGFDVAVCDRLRAADSGKWRNLAKHPIVDFVAPEALFEWLGGRGRDVAAVVHMGAISSTRETDADLIVHTNFTLSRDLFDWCAREGRRFVYASSAAVYGDGALGFDDDPSLASIASLRPFNPYGWSKQLFDAYVARRPEHRNWTGLRFFNVYGPNEYHKGSMRSVVAGIWPAIEAGDAVRLFRSYRDDYADGGQERDFVHVGDAANVVAWLVRNPDASGVFNVGSGRARTFEDLARATFAAANLEPRIEFIDMPDDLRAAYQYYTQADLRRLRAAGYDAPFASIEDGVADYVRRYLASADPYR
jgi:ADP-L-glycero-D-manno-heptose 6-epimerase